MQHDRPDISDIKAAIDEGRVTNPDVVAEWLQLRIDEHVRHARQVRAHATQQLRDRAHQALDAALSGDGTDEFSRLFPPSRPLGPPLTHEAEPPTNVVYDAPDRQGKRSRPRPAASAVSDDDLYNAMFPDEYQRRTWGGA